MAEVLYKGFDRDIETMAICPWCKGAGKRLVNKHDSLKCTQRFVPTVKCEACKGLGQVTASEYRRLTASGVRKIGECGSTSK